MFNLSLIEHTLHIPELDYLEWDKNIEINTMFLASDSTQEQNVEYILEKAQYLTKKKKTPPPSTQNKFDQENVLRKNVLKKTRLVAPIKKLETVLWFMTIVRKKLEIFYNNYYFYLKTDFLFTHIISDLKVDHVTKI